MPERVRHCPFLNRSDARCSTHFSIDTLSAAFGHCLGVYPDCPTYRELLAERRARRAGAADPTARGMYPGQAKPVRAARRDAAPEIYGSPIVPLTLTLTAADRRGAAGRPVA